MDLIENTFIGEMDASESEKKAQIKLSASLCSKVRPRSIRELAIFNVFHFQFYLKVSLSTKLLSIYVILFQSICNNFAFDNCNDR